MRAKGRCDAAGMLLNKGTLALPGWQMSEPRVDPGSQGFAVNTAVLCCCPKMPSSMRSPGSMPIIGELAFWPCCTVAGVLPTRDGVWRFTDAAK